MLLLRISCAPHLRLGQLPKLFGREAEIAGDRVADRAARDRDAALARVDLGVGESELGLKNKNCDTEGERRTQLGSRRRRRFGGDWPLCRAITALPLTAPRN
jgi:hypothetical protein